jgi:hypothetical protein
MYQSLTWANPGFYAADMLEPRVQQGLILIPDISGYSEFVEQSDIVLGKHIVYKLLSAIIGANTLGMAVSEIEGDAVLFYRYGPPPSVRMVLAQFEQMLDGFNNVLSQVNPKPNGLSLKMIAHYGPLTEFQIGQFRKLYGQTLTIAHRLLKNSVESRCYVLMTDELMNAAGQTPVSLLGSGRPASQLCEVYGRLREICFSYFNYDRSYAGNKGTG